ncbi:MAG: NAD(P)/FAD-dependent oxidoreductase [Solirubrobacterales bacterium]
MAKKATPPSLWLDPAPEAGKPLEGERKCDCVVIGAGYTGLSAALAMAEAGADVVVLERDYAGFGASGRNAGHLTPTIGKDLPTLLRLYGTDRGGALVRLAEEAIEHTEQTIDERGIDCDYEPSGNVLAGIHPGQAKTLEKAARAGRELGGSLRMLSTEEIEQRGLPAHVACGYLEERGGVLDPGKYVRGLREAAVGAGAKLYEGTRVASIAEGTGSGRRGIRVETPRGRVAAEHCVLATNAYTPELGLLRSRIVPLRVSLFATEPLSEEQRERVGWPGREGVYTAHEILESYRLTADDRIVGGSRYISYAWGSRIPPDDDPVVFRKLETMFRSRFGELSDVRVERNWSGPIAMPLDFLPCIGRTGRAGKIVYSLGYAGHGVAMASHLGTLAAGMVLRGEPGPAPLVSRRRVPLPPEPFRWLVAKAIIGALEAVDRRTDSRAQPRAPKPPSRDEAATKRVIPSHPVSYGES